jgi:hypothetical protein
MTFKRKLSKKEIKTRTCLIISMLLGFNFIAKKRRLKQNLNRME